MRIRFPFAFLHSIFLESLFWLFSYDTWLTLHIYLVISLAKCMFCLKLPTLLHGRFWVFVVVFGQLLPSLGTVYVYILTTLSLGGALPARLALLAVHQILSSCSGTSCLFSCSPWSSCLLEASHL